MIKEFSSLYVGHIDMENLGMEGTPANDRRYSNGRLIEAFDTTLELAQLMDRLGYSTLWLAEHHFQPEGYECIPNILMLGMHSRNIRNGLRSAAASTSLPCGIRSGWPKTSPPPTS